MAKDLTEITYQEFAKSMAEFAPFENNPIIAVAVSGGADSMSLVYLADHWAKSKGGKVIALSVDHDLRPESGQEIILIKSWLEQAGIQHVALKWEHLIKPVSNIQAKAREARYSLLASWCQSHDILHLLLGHQQDDQAETLLINLERGSGLDGLSAMPRMACYKAVRILRPLLDIPKARLKLFLQKQKLSWIEDPSNINPKFTRSRIREFLQDNLVNNSTLTARLAETAANMQRVRSSIEHNVARIMAECVTVYQEGFATILYRNFLGLYQEEALRVLSAVIVCIGGRKHKLRFDSLKLLYNKLIDRQITSAVTLGGCKIKVKNDTEIVIYRELPKKCMPYFVNAEQKSLWWDNRFLVTIHQELSKMNSNISINFIGPDGLLYLREVLGKKLESGLKNIPRDILITLPGIMLLDKIQAVPHIDYYKDTNWQKGVKIVFHPYAQLTGVM